jgi:hypothetical protein
MARVRRKLTESEARSLVVEWRASGKALPAWCAARGLDGRSLRYWADRLGANAELRMVEMVGPVAPRVSSAGIHLRVQGVTIVVAEAFSEETLTRVLRTVRAC